MATYSSATDEFSQPVNQNKDAEGRPISGTTHQGDGETPYTHWNAYQGLINRRRVVAAGAVPTTYMKKGTLIFEKTSDSQLLGVSNPGSLGQSVGYLGNTNGDIYLQDGSQGKSPQIIWHKNESGTYDLIDKIHIVPGDGQAAELVAVMTTVTPLPIGNDYIKLFGMTTPTGYEAGGAVDDEQHIQADIALARTVTGDTTTTNEALIGFKVLGKINNAWTEIWSESFQHPFTPLNILNFPLDSYAHFTDDRFSTLDDEHPNWSNWIADQNVTAWDFFKFNTKKIKDMPDLPSGTNLEVDLIFTTVWDTPQGVQSRVMKNVRWSDGHSEPSLYADDNVIQKLKYTK